jgi:putative glycosyltransferase (TIGR04348 family)
LRILIVGPKVANVPTGNHCTAQQWAAIIASIGHDVTFHDSPVGESCDLLVALHAEKSHGIIENLKSQNPGLPVILALTGTDIYPAPAALALDAMQLADALVVLQAKALDRIPAQHLHKSHVIVQSVQKFVTPPEHTEKSRDPFLICVAGHLRDVKDPLRAAQAARKLPASSNIRIEHVGAVLDRKYDALVMREQEENPRYVFLGERTCAQVQELMHRSQASILSSHAEGGARVIGESIVEGTPILATRIDGVTGLVGDDYPGLFTAGNTTELAMLLEKLETDAAFMTLLHSEVNRLAPEFAPDLERDAWHRLINQLVQVDQLGAPAN